jgi:hypothetical protein
VLALALLLPDVAFGAVAASLASSTISSASTTPVELHVTGIPVGASVTVERFADANANGVTDAGEALLDSFTVTDGQDIQIGGVRNTNIPRDKDQAVDGQVTVNINPARGAEIGRFAGAHLIRVSSPSAAFGEVSCVLTVTQPAQSQTISGTVLQGSAPVSYAIVALLDATTDGEFVLAVAANATGQFTVNAPVGSYQLFAVKPGYVANLGSAPIVVLGSGATPTQNLSLTAATTSISGKVADSSTATGLPGVQLFIQSQNGLVTIVSTVADGTYSAPVTSDDWQIQVSGISLQRLGYVELNDQSSTITAGTTGGPATGVNANLPKATALISGTVTNTAGTPQAGIWLNVNDSGNLYTGDAITDGAGKFVFGVVAGSWQVYISDTSPGLGGYLRPNNNSVAITAGQALTSNFTLTTINAHVQGTVTKNGNAVSGITIAAFSQNTNQFVTTQTAANGSFDLGLIADSWTVGIESTSAAAFTIVSPTLNYTLSANQTITGVAVPVLDAPGTISGTVTDRSGNPVAFANVYAYTTIGATLYGASAQTNASGHYSFPVNSNTWTVGANGNGLNFANQIVAVTGSATVNLSATYFTQQPADQTVDAGQSATFNVQTNAPGTFTLHWEYSTNGGSTWNPVPESAPYSGVTGGSLLINPTSLGMSGNRYRCLLSGSFNPETTTSALLTVNPALQITTVSPLPDGRVGENYSFSFGASGGHPPYHWYLPGGMSALPPGTMSLSDNGTLSGTPSSAGNYTFTVGVGNNDWSGQITQSMSLTIAPSAVSPLQAWRLALLGTTSNSGTAADTADPDADGIPNLLEYALGLNPLVANTAGLPVASPVADHLAFTFNRAGGTTDITYKVEATSVLGGTWTELYSAPGPAIADQVTVTDPLTISGNPRRFLRLLITSP